MQLGISSETAVLFNSLPILFAAHLQQLVFTTKIIISVYHQKFEVLTQVSAMLTADAMLIQLALAVVYAWTMKSP